MKSNGEHVDASAENKQSKKTNSTVKKNATNSFERLRGGDKTDRISGAIQIIQHFKGNHVEIQHVSNLRFDSLPMVTNESIFETMLICSAFFLDRPRKDEM